MADNTMAYKKSSCTYKLPGEGSREVDTPGTFRKDNRAMQAGLIVEGGFGDLSSSYEGSTPANFMGGTMLDPSTVATAGKIAEENAPSGGDDVRAALKKGFENAENADFTPVEQTWTEI